VAIQVGDTVVMLPHKHGTSFILRALQAKYGDQARLVRPGTRHLPLWEMLEAEREGKRIVGLVRNPFAFYVSRWLYVKNEVHPDSPPFADALRSMDRLFGRWSSGEPAGSYSQQHVGFHMATMPAAPTHDLSLLAVREIVRLEKVGLWLRDELRLAPGHMGQWRNSQSYGDYRTWYNKELRALVEEMDGPVLERYSYTF